MKRKRLQNQRRPPREKTRARLEMVRDRLVLALPQLWVSQENVPIGSSSYLKSVMVRENARRSTTSSKLIKNNQGIPACLWNNKIWLLQSCIVVECFKGPKPFSISYGIKREETFQELFKILSWDEL